MANAPRGKRPQQGARKSSRNRRGDKRPQRQRNTSAPGSSSHSRRGTLTRPDTGYTLHSRRVRRDAAGASALLNPRVLLLVLIVVLVITAIAMGITSCVNKGASNSPAQSTEEGTAKNEQDARVAAGVSAKLTSEFTKALDQADLIAQIAQNANSYKDERLLELALREPESLDFVAGYPASDKKAKTFTGKVKRGEVPRLYNWDPCWGAVTYGDGPIAVTGSGPTTLSMAYMGLTGLTDQTPATIAKQASKTSSSSDSGSNSNSSSDSSSGSDSSSSSSTRSNGQSGGQNQLFTKTAPSIGLTTEEIDISADTLLYTLGDNTVIAAELAENTLTDEAHWVLIANYDDGNLTIFDPSSSSVSSHMWSASTIADASDRMYSITITDEDLQELESNSKGSSSSKGSSTSSSSSSSSSSKGSSSSNGSDEDEDSSSSSSSRSSSSSSSSESESDSTSSSSRSTY